MVEEPGSGVEMTDSGEGEVHQSMESDDGEDGKGDEKLDGGSPRRGGKRVQDEDGANEVVEPRQKRSKWTESAASVGAFAVAWYYLWNWVPKLV